MNKKQFYITTPIYYVNDTPHIGHAYTTIAADTLARYHRLLGDDVFFLTGTDEYGQKVAEASAKKGRTPQEHVDEMVVSFQDLWKRLNISNNKFVRTTNPDHHQGVQKALMTLWEKKEIYEDTYTGWYCLPDERFWTEKDLVDGKCPDCMRPVTPLSEKNYFFKMGQYQERLRNHLDEHPDFIEPASRRNEILGFLEKPLGDLCISRPKSRLAWGIPIPFDSDYVTYVWFDALINYISMRGYGTATLTAGHVAPGWPADIHLVGKDILTTHAVYWSTMLMALDLPLPQKLFAHGWWTVNGEKMSKSRGNVVNPHEVITEVGVEPFRYFLLREVPFGDDGNFSHDALTDRYNSDLANDLGNLVSRTLTLIEKFSGGNVIPNPKPQQDDYMPTFANHIFNPFSEAMNHLRFQIALGEIWKCVSQANAYIQQQAPWNLDKTQYENPRHRDQLENVLYTLAESLRIIALYLSPFMPETAAAIEKSLGLSDDYQKISFEKKQPWGWEGLPGKIISKCPALFPRLDKKKKMEPNKDVVLSPIPASSTPSITIEDFCKTELRVGLIKAAERIPKSSKLLKLQVDIGQEKPRQVVAGIAEKYEPESLIGKRIILVCNLVPVKLKGVLSEGMLLAAGADGVLELATFLQEIPPGTKIK
ncbi:MAG: methionine--tRNA ligase [Nitrospirota bacterium]